MAKAKCLKCGSYYSGKLTGCPECGTVPGVFICPECGALYGVEYSQCNFCKHVPEGAPVPATTDDISEELEYLRSELEKDHSAEYLKAVRENLQLISRYEKADEDLAEVNELLLSRSFENIRHDTEEKARQIAEADNIPAKEINEVLKKLDAFNDNSSESFDELTGRLTEKKYDAAKTLLDNARTESDAAEAAGIFEDISGFKDSDRLSETGREKAAELKKAARRKRTAAAAIAAAAVICVSGAYAAVTWIIPESHYSAGTSSFAAGDFSTAYNEYEKAKGYKDADALMTLSSLALHYSQGAQAESTGNFEKAVEEFSLASGYSDAYQREQDAKYKIAESTLAKGDIKKAASLFAGLGDHSDSKSRIVDCAYALIDAGEYDEALSIITLSGSDNAKDAEAYCKGAKAFENMDYETALTELKTVPDMADAPQMLAQLYSIAAEEAIAGDDYAKAYESLIMLADYTEDKETQQQYIFLAGKAAFENGMPARAKACFDTLPENYESNGIKTERILGLLNLRPDITGLSGKWSSSAGEDHSIKEVSYTTGIFSLKHERNAECTLELRCHIADNGRLTLHGITDYYRYTEFADDSIVKETLEFEHDIIATPYSFDADDNVKVTVTSDNITVEYHYTELTGGANYYDHASTCVFDILDENY